MRRIELNQREARLLRQNLTENNEGYDYVDLCKLDWLSKKINGLLGEYGEAVAACARRERQLRRAFAKGEISQIDGDRQLMAVSYEVEDLDEAAESIMVELTIEDRDHKLIEDKIDAVGQWRGGDALRSTIIGMVSAVKNAKSIDLTAMKGVDEPERVPEPNGEQANVSHIRKSR